MIRLLPRYDAEDDASPAKPARGRTTAGLSVLTFESSVVTSEVSMNERSRRAVTKWIVPLLAIWPVAVVILGVAHHRSYDSVDRAMSELALTRGGWLIDVGFIAMGAAIIGIAVTLTLASSRGIVGRVLLAVAGFLVAVSGFAHTNGPNEAASTHSRIHEAAGIASFVLFIDVMYALVRPFRRDERWSPMAMPTLLWAVVATGGFFLIPLLGEERFGLAQRTFVATWLSWLFVVATRVRRLAASHRGGDSATSSGPGLVSR
jgi:hypothetical protein